MQYSITPTPRYSSLEKFSKPDLVTPEMNPPLILVVDDEQGVRESLRMVFGKEFRVLEADSVDTAIRTVEDDRPELVLLDIVMPKTDGLELLRQIKTIHPGCEVIMLTASNLQRNATKAMEFGAFDFIGKPFDVAELRRKVNSALEKVLQKRLG